MLQPRNVIAIPNINEAREHPELSVGQDVLALYPSTTCFYKARIVEPPSKVNNSIRSQQKKKAHIPQNKDAPGNYKVQFEDDNNEFQYVMPGHVLELPKPKQ